MRKTIITIALALIAVLPSFAQMSIGAGYLESTKKVGSVSSAQNGFYVGAENTIGDFGPFKVTPGVYFEYATSSESTDFFGLAGTTGKSTEMYLDVPVNFSYGVDFEGARLFGYAGPTFSLGCLSNIETSASVLGQSSGVTTIDQYEQNGNYGRFDLMVGGGVGVDIDVLRLTIGYNYGLIDRDGGSADLHRTCLRIGLALLF